MLAISKTPTVTDHHLPEAVARNKCWCCYSLQAYSLMKTLPQAASLSLLKNKFLVVCREWSYLYT